MLIRGTLAAISFLVGASLANAADLAVEPDLGQSSYSYLQLEGGYIHFDGEDVQSFLLGDRVETLAPHTSVDLSHGFYGRAEIGNVGGLVGGPLNGVAAYVQGWGGDHDISESHSGEATGLLYHGDEGVVGAGFFCVDPCVGKSDLERSLIEGGLRFFHDFSPAADLNGVSLGIEPFVALIQENTKSTLLIGDPDPAMIRSSDLDATALGALIALDGRFNLSSRARLTGRIAAGGYHMDADVDTRAELPNLSRHDDLSSEFAGFRAQAAVGLDYAITDTMSFGVIGRLDYWSDFPTIKWTDTTFITLGEPNSIADDNLLTASVGLRLSILLGSSN